MIRSMTGLMLIVCLAACEEQAKKEEPFGRIVKGISGLYLPKVIKTGSGDYFLAGQDYAGFGGAPIVLARISSSGDTVWTRKKTDSERIDLIAFEASSDDEILISYQRGMNVCAAKFDGNGTAKFDRTVSGETRSALAIRGHGGGLTILVRDSTFVRLMEVNTDGETTWTNRIDVDRSYFLSGLSKTSNGYLFYGYKDSSTVFLTDGIGNLQWNRRLAITYYESACSTEDGSIVLAGHRYNKNGSQISLTELGFDGNLLGDTSVPAYSMEPVQLMDVDIQGKIRLFREWPAGGMLAMIFGHSLDWQQTVILHALEEDQYLISGTWSKGYVITGRTYYQGAVLPFFFEVDGNLRILE